jgi:WW domain-binding protein 11
MGEKRRKLAETWDRVIKRYEKENPEQYADLKKLWMNYQGRKIEVVKYYESVMSAQVGSSAQPPHTPCFTQEVDVDDIPMPSFDDHGYDDGTGGIPLPQAPPPMGPPKSVLKKPPSVLEKGKSLLCPGVPACLPPSVADYEVEEYEEGARRRKIKFGDEGDEEDEPARGGGEAVARVAPTGPNSLQKKMLAMAGQDLDQFMKEMEVVHKTREAEKAAELTHRLARLDGEEETMVPPGLEVSCGAGPGPMCVQAPPGATPPGPPPGVPPSFANRCPLPPPRPASPRPA